MRITLICPVYPPEVMPSAVMLSQLADRLSQTGHDVSIYTMFPSLPEGKVFAGYKRRLWKTCNQNGVRVSRCFSFTIGRRRNPLWRVLSHLSFSLTAGLRLLFSDKPDVLLMEVFPIISAPIFLLISMLKRVPVINYIKDMYPEAAEAAGMTENGSIVSRACRWLDGWVCRHSDVNVVLSEVFESQLMETRKVPKRQAEVVYDWIDGSLINPVPRNNLWRKENNLPTYKFVAMFAGTMGIASGADILVDVAEQLDVRGRNDILVVCIGEGLLKDRMLEAARNSGLPNLIFFPFQPAERLSEVQSSADIMLLPVQENHESSSVPSKLITYLAAGKPVLYIGGTESPIAKIISKADCGSVVPVRDPVKVAESLIEIALDRDELERKGRNARAYFEEHFEMGIGMAKFEGIFQRFHGAVKPIPVADQFTSGSD